MKPHFLLLIIAIFIGGCLNSADENANEIYVITIKAADAIDVEPYDYIALYELTDIAIPAIDKINNEFPSSQVAVDLASGAILIKGFSSQDLIDIRRKLDVLKEFGGSIENIIKNEITRLNNHPQKYELAEMFFHGLLDIKSTNEDLLNQIEGILITPQSIEQPYGELTSNIALQYIKQGKIERATTIYNEHLRQCLPGNAILKCTNMDDIAKISAIAGGLQYFDDFELVLNASEIGSYDFLAFDNPLSHLIKTNKNDAIRYIDTVLAYMAKSKENVHSNDKQSFNWVSNYFLNNAASAFIKNGDVDQALSIISNVEFSEQDSFYNHSGEALIKMGREEMLVNRRNQLVEHLEAGKLEHDDIVIPMLYLAIYLSDKTGVEQILNTQYKLLNDGDKALDSLTSTITMTDILKRQGFEEHAQQLLMIVYDKLPELDGWDFDNRLEQLVWYGDLDVIAKFYREKETNEFPMQFLFAIFNKLVEDEQNNKPQSLNTIALYREISINNQLGSIWTRRAVNSLRASSG